MYKWSYILSCKHTSSISQCKHTIATCALSVLSVISSAKWIHLKALIVVQIVHVEAVYAVSVEIELDAVGDSRGIDDWRSLTCSVCWDKIALVALLADETLTVEDLASWVDWDAGWLRRKVAGVEASGAETLRWGLSTGCLYRTRNALTVGNCKTGVASSALSSAYIESSAKIVDSNTIQLEILIWSGCAFNTYSLKPLSASGLLKSASIFSDTNSVFEIVSIVAFCASTGR